uniref:Uncharacterized protein n=1 Tax=Romanomermis culicivorax TaxID=13658 RepID=A0A915KZY9_ROMCU
MLTQNQNALREQLSNAVPDALLTLNLMAKISGLAYASEKSAIVDHIHDLGHPLCGNNFILGSTNLMSPSPRSFHCGPLEYCSLQMLSKRNNLALALQITSSSERIKEKMNEKESTYISAKKVSNSNKVTEKLRQKYLHPPIKSKYPQKRVNSASAIRIGIRRLNHIRQHGDSTKPEPDQSDGVGDQE